MQLKYCFLDDLFAALYDGLFIASGSTSAVHWHDYGGREGHSESGWCTPGPGLRTQQNRTPDPGIYGSGLRDQQYRSPDELKIPDSGLRARIRG